MADFSYSAQIEAKFLRIVPVNKDFDFEMCCVCMKVYMINFSVLTTEAANRVPAKCLPTLGMCKSVVTKTQMKKDNERTPLVIGS